MIEIVGIAILCNMLTHWFTPIQRVKMWFTDKMPLWMATPFLCSKCAGFWVGLIYFQDPILAAITSLASYIIDNVIYFIEEWKSRN